MNTELLIIFVLSFVVIEILEYEKSSIHSLIITIGAIFIFIDLNNILTLTDKSLEYAYTMIGIIPVMGSYKMILLYKHRNSDLDDFL